MSKQVPDWIQETDHRLIECPLLMKSFVVVLILATIAQMISANEYDATSTISNYHGNVLNAFLGCFGVDGCKRPNDATMNQSLHPEIRCKNIRDVKTCNIIEACLWMAGACDVLVTDTIKYIEDPQLRQLQINFWMTVKNAPLLSKLIKPDDKWKARLTQALDKFPSAFTRNIESSYIYSHLEFTKEQRKSLKQCIVDNFQLVSYEEFAKELRIMAQWLLYHQINTKGVVIIRKEFDYVRKPNKRIDLGSNEWLLANLLDYGIKPLLVRYSVEYAVSPDMRDFFIIDDASYSGTQIVEFAYYVAKSLYSSRLIRLFIATPFISLTARIRIMKLKLVFPLMEILFFEKAHIIPEMSQSCLDLIGGSQGKHLLAFQHKIPDELSIPVLVSSYLLIQPNFQEPPYKHILMKRLKK